MSDEFELRHSEPIYSKRTTATVMDEAASRPWNLWVTEMIRREILAHEKALLRGIREAVSELIETKVGALEIEIGQVRADQTIERAHKGEVIDLPTGEKGERKWPTKLR
jgi:hypothetical protein